MNDVPRLYDMEMDEFRPVTQDDWDLAHFATQLLGRLLTAYRKDRTAGQECSSQLKVIVDGFEKINPNHESMPAEVVLARATDLFVALDAAKQNGATIQ